MKFAKMHGCGNDYIIINGITENIEKPEELAIKLSNRNYGIGSDGIIIIYKSRRADFFMKIYNSDGSLARMCGNGIRCAAKYAFDKKLTIKRNLRIETDSGIKFISINEISKITSNVSVNMGSPVFRSRAIPINTDKDRIINEYIKIDDFIYNISCVSIGNNHVVIFLDDIYTGEVEDLYNKNMDNCKKCDISFDNLDIKRLGRILENDKMFVNGTNVEFVKVIDKNNLDVRVWERGSGMTLACGTGACASAICGYITNRCNSSVNVKMSGGVLKVDCMENGKKIILTGDATMVYEGEIFLK